MNIQAQSMDLNAAADFLGPGALEVPIFEKEILDVVRRSSVALKRFKTKRATGHPHRYFEQTAIATGAAVDPRNLSASATTPTRVERPAFIKAVTAQTNISMFDKDVTEQQGQFDQVVATDIDDITNAVEVKRGQMLWAGSDTSLTSPTTLEWMGALAQIAGGGGSSSVVNVTCGLGVSIIDTIKTTVANMMGQQGFDVVPTAIYADPILLDLIDQEAKAAHIDLKTAEVTAGVTVKYISTQAGDLPLIPDVYMPIDTTGKYGFSTSGSNKQHYVAIITEPLTEIAYISGKKDDPNPRLFQLGLTGNLAGQFVAVKFDTLIVKGAGYAHGLICVQRPQ
jgi:hypothetical protein